MLWYGTPFFSPSRLRHSFPGWWEYRCWQFVAKYFSENCSQLKTVPLPKGIPSGEQESNSHPGTGQYRVTQALFNSRPLYGSFQLQRFSIGWAMSLLHSIIPLLMLLILTLGKIAGRRRREWQRMRWLDGVTDSMDMSLSKLQAMVKGRETWRATVHGVTKSQIRLSYWTITITLLSFPSSKNSFRGNFSINFCMQWISISTCLLVTLSTTHKHSLKTLCP